MRGTLVHAKGAPPRVHRPGATATRAGSGEETASTSGSGQGVNPSGSRPRRETGPPSAKAGGLRAADELLAGRAEEQTQFYSLVRRPFRSPQEITPALG